MKEKTCCFTGHRQIPAAQAEEIKLWLYWTIKELHNRYGVCYFGSGGAIGFDMMAANAVLDLRAALGIKLIMVLPCQDQSARWRNEEKEQHKKLLQQADKVVCLAEKYYDGCMQARNRHLVDCSGWCVSYQTKGFGGTAYTTGYAKHKGLEIINFPKKIY